MPIVPPQSCGLMVSVQGRPTKGRVWMVCSTGYLSQLHPSSIIRTGAAGHRWIPGRSVITRQSPGEGLLTGRSLLRPTACRNTELLLRGNAQTKPGPVPGPNLLLHLGTVTFQRRNDIARRPSGWVSRIGPSGIPFSGLLHYNIYSNLESGESVRYTSPIASLVSTLWTSPCLASPGVWSFGVRAADANGEEQNLDANVTIVLDASGNDITSRPSSPVGLRAFPLPSGSARVEWFSPLARGASAPMGFHVYIGIGTGPDYAAPVATIPYGQGFFNTFVANVTGLTSGVTYRIGVRAYNTSGEEPNTVSVAVVADAVGPGPVDLLISRAIV